MRNRRMTDDFQPVWLFHSSNIFVMAEIFYIDVLTEVFVSYEIYETSIRRVS